MVIAHGINEHIGRYAHVAAALNRAGYSVVGVDHRGHGRSDGGKPRTSNVRRFDQFVDDYIAVNDVVLRESGGPVVVLGHSMGGLIAARAALRIQERLAGLILSGPALRIPTDLSGIALRVSLAVARLAPFLRAPGGESAALSRNPEVREAFARDDLCIQEPVRLGIARQLYLLSEETRRQASEIRLPLLVMHGAADVITDPTGSEAFVRDAQSSDKEYVSWPDDHHEIFNEMDAEIIIARMIAWLGAHCAAWSGT